MSQGLGHGFLDALLNAAGQADPRPKVEAVLKQWAGETVYIPRAPIDRTETAADLARRLVFAGVGRGAAVEILLQRRDLSPRHARRLVRVAVDMRLGRMSVSPPMIDP